MKIAIPKERAPGEDRVAASIEVIGKLINLGCEVVVESGAGDGASISDDAFKNAGASIAKDFAATVKDTSSHSSDRREHIDQMILHKGAPSVAAHAPFPLSSPSLPCDTRAMSRLPAAVLPPTHPWRLAMCSQVRPSPSSSCARDICVSHMWLVCLCLSCHICVSHM